MAKAGLALHSIRKSSQWMTLQREHAQAITSDTKMAPVFAKHCITYWNSADDWYTSNCPIDVLLPRCCTMCRADLSVMHHEHTQAHSNMACCRNLDSLEAFIMITKTQGQLLQ